MLMGCHDHLACKEVVSDIDLHLRWCAGLWFLPSRVPLALTTAAEVHHFRSRDLQIEYELDPGTVQNPGHGEIGQTLDWP